MIILFIQLIMIVEWWGFFPRSMFADACVVVKLPKGGFDRELGHLEI